jgi:nucleotide-binding universal stress UspA family protein
MAAAAPSLLYITDFSDASLQALHWAIPEALKHHLHISVLYPYRLDQVRKKDNAILSKKDLDLDASEKFERLVESVLKNSRVTYNFHAEVGFLRDRIVEHARKNNVVMLVMGKGQVVEESFPELVQELNIPLVIVPSRKG